MAVVKANAYGHGAAVVSSYIDDIVDGFCVSNIDEALELREGGLDKNLNFRCLSHRGSPSGG